MNEVNKNFGMKELYDVFIKATFPIEINGRLYEEGETIISFDKIQISYLDEIKARTSAQGGFANTSLITWEKTSEINFSVSEGVVSKIGLALLSNSQLEKNEDYIPLSYHQLIETDENGEAILKYPPINPIFVYKESTGEKITFDIDGFILKTSSPYTNLVVDYNFEYTLTSSTMKIGERMINGYLKLEGKMRVKDDTDGKSKTAILIIPRIRLTSDLSIRLGKQANPVVSSFSFAGFPSDDRRNPQVAYIIYIDNDIDSDF